MTSNEITQNSNVMDTKGKESIGIPWGSQHTRSAWKEPPEPLGSLNVVALEDFDKSRKRARCRGCLPKQCCMGGEGHKAWLLLLRVFIYNMIQAVNFGSFGLLYVNYTTTFQTTKAVIGWIISIQYTVSGAIG